MANLKIKCNTTAVRTMKKYGHCACHLSSPSFQSLVCIISQHKILHSGAATCTQHSLLSWLQLLTTCSCMHMSCCICCIVNLACSCHHAEHIAFAILPLTTLAFVHLLLLILLLNCLCVHRLSWTTLALVHLLLLGLLLNYFCVHRPRPKCSWQQQISMWLSCSSSCKMPWSSSSCSQPQASHTLTAYTASHQVINFSC